MLSNIFFQWCEWRCLPDRPWHHGFIVKCYEYHRSGIQAKWCLENCTQWLECLAKCHLANDYDQHRRRIVIIRMIAVWVSTNMPTHHIQIFGKCQLRGKYMRRVFSFFCSAHFTVMYTNRIKFIASLTFEFLGNWYRIFFYLFQLIKFLFHYVTKTQ